MQKYSLQYINHIKEIINAIENTQLDNINKAAEKLANTVENGHTIFAFGASHAGIIVEEMFYRTGGFVLINPIFNPTLMLNTRPVTLTSKVERIENFGTEIIKHSPLKKGDVLILHSVSGRNPVIIDAAIEAKKIGAFIIGITNITYSIGVESRHKSKKRLFEVSDLVINNCGDFEDSSIKIDGLEQKIGATSTIAGAAIVNSIIVETCSLLKEKGIEPPVFHSANVDGGDEFNKKILEQYKDRVYYL